MRAGSKTAPRLRKYRKKDQEPVRIRSAAVQERHVISNFYERQNGMTKNRINTVRGFSSENPSCCGRTHPTTASYSRMLGWAAGLRQRTWATHRRDWQMGDVPSICAHALINMTKSGQTRHEPARYACPSWHPGPRYGKSRAGVRVPASPRTYRAPLRPIFATAQDAQNLNIPQGKVRA